VANRAQAAAAVAEGRVLVGGAIADKPARLVAAGEAVVLTGPGPRFVSRGGEKLDAALERFAVPVKGLTALDAGASTGGFTDCLLQRGAAHVYAVDVGHGQLDPRLRNDERVSVHERTNIRSLAPDDLAEPARPFEPVDLLTADLSFISLVTVAPALSGPLVRENGDLVVLVKPQFEAGRAEVSRGKGVITDPGIWQRTVTAAVFALAANGTGIMGVMPSPIAGPAGNREFLVHGRSGAATPENAAAAAMVAAAVEEASSSSGAG
jgi:23S rRNA (cytidine1920-2'-O)/16S rRNA (cytidine1409-2'-O)-methyltransferase